MLNQPSLASLDGDFSPGTIRSVFLDMPELPNGAQIQLPIAVIDGAEPGPTCWISAAIHGDEINGVAIVRKLVQNLDPMQMKGRLLAVPIVDVYGFNVGSRYLPDRRDLNRMFPGTKRGSLAGRLAHLFVTEIVDRCEAGIDLHTAAQGRSNLPQVRGVLDDPKFPPMAEAFAAPVTMNSRIIEGSLREVAAERDIPYLLYEAGAAGYFDEAAIEIGFNGCQRVLQYLGMADVAPEPKFDPVLIDSGKWVRAPNSGVLDTRTSLGDSCEKGQVLATITNTFGQDAEELVAPFDGLVVGMSIDPLLQSGDAVFNIGRRG